MKLEQLLENSQDHYLAIYFVLDDDDGAQPRYMGIFYGIVDQNKKLLTNLTTTYHHAYHNRFKKEMNTIKEKLIPVAMLPWLQVQRLTDEQLSTVIRHTVNKYIANEDIVPAIDLKIQHVRNVRLSSGSVVIGNGAFEQSTLLKIVNFLSNELRDKSIKAGK